MSTIPEIVTGLELDLGGSVYIREAMASRRSKKKQPAFVHREGMTAFPQRILVADHHPDSLPDVHEPLSARGHTVLHSSDPVSTLDTLERRRPDLLLLSPLSDNPNGPELLRILGAKDRSAYTPLLLVLDDATVDSSLADLIGRADDVIRRSRADERTLVECVELALGRLKRIRDLERSNRSLKRQSITDFKTNTFNDRYFHQRLREEFSRARRHRAPISCIMLDFDNFKEINDNFDHAFGDFVLLAFAKKLRSIIRDIDIPARFGGDEFVVLLPNTGLDEAVVIAERVRSIVGSYKFEHGGLSTSVGLSMGIAAYDGVEDSSAEDLLRRADRALLEAKRRGRDRIVLYPQVGRSDDERIASPSRPPGRALDAGATG